MGLATIMFGSVTMEELSFPNENSNARGGIFYSDGAWYYEYDLGRCFTAITPIYLRR